MYYRLLGNKGLLDHNAIDTALSDRSPEIPMSEIMASDGVDTEQRLGSQNYRLCAWFQRIRRSRKGAIVVVALALFTDMVLYDVIVPILPALVKRVGVDGHKVGFLFATYAIGVLSFTPVFGIWSDNVKSSKIPMMVGQAGLAASTLLFAHAGHYHILIIARFLQGK